MGSLEPVRKLVHRPRRLRRSAGVRNLVRETSLSAHDFVLPLFVSEKVGDRRANREHARRLSAFRRARRWRKRGCAGGLGLQAVLLFGIPAQKDEQATGAYAEDGIVQQAVARDQGEGAGTGRDHGCLSLRIHEPRPLRGDPEGRRPFSRLNDATVELLVKTALSHAAAGADMVAPSDMMDGRIGAIREALDAAWLRSNRHHELCGQICSVFYGPFREAAESPPQFGDRRSYQMDCANAAEALREAALDVEEGADIFMVKPALPYLDILWRVRERFGKPTAVYHVSGEYAMVKAAVEKGCFEERPAVLEIMTSLKRAGADMIVTYWAKELAGWTRD